MKRATKSEERAADAIRAVQEASPRQSSILVVEEDPDLLWRISRMLTVQGNRVVGTSSGDGALALVSQWPVDLVFVAENLPTTRGVDLCRRIRETHPAVDTVLMTRRDDPETCSMAKQAGISACVSKPFRGETFAELLASLATPEPGTVAAI